MLKIFPPPLGGEEHQPHVQDWDSCLPLPWGIHLTFGGGPVVGSTDVREASEGYEIMNNERTRLEEDARRKKNWKRWGPYLSERQWGTVREDYSADGSSWDYFPHDQARSRSYRWGEDGLLGITDRQGRMAFAPALWNGKDSILKERLFGLTGTEGNHGEDVKECYYYLDGSPTHTYLKALYQYPQAEFPYDRLLEENRRRGREAPEFELLDTGVFDENRYFSLLVEYAKASPDDVLIRLTVINRGPDPAELHLPPTFWFRNTWSWGREGEGYWAKPRFRKIGKDVIDAAHESLGKFTIAWDRGKGENEPLCLFTENETNNEKLFGNPNESLYTKDAFHEYVIRKRKGAVNPENEGTKAAIYFRETIPAGESREYRLRLTGEERKKSSFFGNGFDDIFHKRIDETNVYYSELIAEGLDDNKKTVMRQGYAGLLWTKQFYHYSVGDWLEGDPNQSTPSVARKHGRNHDWSHLYNRDVISMPDKWEYPWYAAWDLAFHMIPFARLDPQFAKDQLTLLLREWYMHPNGQLPAYEWAFADVNPPVHAWAAWRVYKLTGARGQRDRAFLARVFHKLLLNFTWWVNRKDPHGRHVFSGGFLGLDNIGVFDRSQALPTGGHLEQADGTAWMGFYCASMLSMALELARDDHAYEDIASKFFEHFIAIVDAINRPDESGLWDEEDGFYYDSLHIVDRSVPLKVRSLVGLLPLIAVEFLEEDVINSLPGFKKRMNWFIENRKDLAWSMTCETGLSSADDAPKRLLAIPSCDRLEKVLRYLLDEDEFLSPYGIRSLSKIHESKPYVFSAEGTQYGVKYSPAESDTTMFGGNSNWRGPIWMPINFLLIEALERYHHFYGDSLKTELPYGSGNMVTLKEAANEISRRLQSMFLEDKTGARPCHGDEKIYSDDPNWKNLVLFYEYFHGENGRGIGASHQTGWTALVIKLMEEESP